MVMLKLKYIYDFDVVLDFKSPQNWGIFYQKNNYFIIV